jgi:hypothetical protein
MLTINVGETQMFDEGKQEFTVSGGVPLRLEHSLSSLSKWEEKFEKPFLGKDPKSEEEVLFYIRCMCIDPDHAPEALHHLSQSNVDEINAYVDSKRTATWFTDDPGAPKTSETITSELIYYWMTVFNIPFECDKWNLNRLFTLIRICNIKQQPPKKMSRAEIAARNRELNAKRKERFNTTG